MLNVNVCVTVAVVVVILYDIICMFVYGWDVSPSVSPLVCTAKNSVYCFVLADFLYVHWNCWEYISQGSGQLNMSTSCSHE